jgi:hypothetical protein
MDFQLFDCFSNSSRKLSANQLCLLLIFLNFFSLSFACENPEFSNMANTERTFIMCKPDAVQRGLVGEIIKRFEAKGFKLVGMKFKWVSTRELRIFLHNLSTHRLICEIDHEHC